MLHPRETEQRQASQYSELSAAQEASNDVCRSGMSEMKNRAVQGNNQVLADLKNVRHELTSKLDAVSAGAQLTRIVAPTISRTSP